MAERVGGTAEHGDGAAGTPASTSAGHGGPVFVMQQRLDRLHPHPETTHTEHGLTFLMDGWFEMEHGTALRAEAGSVTIMPAGVPHRPLDGEDVHYWIVGFCAGCLGLDESQPLMSPFAWARQGGLPVVQVPEARRDRVAQMYGELQEEVERAAPESRELIRSHVLLLLGEVRRSMATTAAAAAPTLVGEALTFIQQHCLTGISLRDVAKAVHRSPAHVAAAVKDATGHAVGAWIVSARVSEAAAMLVHTDASLDAIAEHVGWKDKTHFIRQFKKLRGSTPAAWRRAQRALHTSSRVTASPASSR